jgi:hypothetical protein
LFIIRVSFCCNPVKFSFEKTNRKFLFFFVRSARYIRWNSDDDFNGNEQRKQGYSHQVSPLMTKIILDKMANEQDRLSPIARRAKAIVKGDPREFMG